MERAGDGDFHSRFVPGAAFPSFEWRVSLFRFGFGIGSGAGIWDLVTSVVNLSARFEPAQQPPG